MKCDNKRYTAEKSDRNEKRFICFIVMIAVAFYDGNSCFVQLVTVPAVVMQGKVDISDAYEKKSYLTYKIMVWENLDSIKPLMTVE